jgi:hypothetical protein
MLPLRAPVDGCPARKEANEMRKVQKGPVGLERPNPEGPENTEEAVPNKLSTKRKESLAEVREFPKLDDRSGLDQVLDHIRMLKAAGEVHGVYIVTVSEDGQTVNRFYNAEIWDNTITLLGALAVSSDHVMQTIRPEDVHTPMK